MAAPPARIAGDYEKALSKYLEGLNALENDLIGNIHSTDKGGYKARFIALQREFNEETSKVKKLNNEAEKDLVQQITKKKSTLLKLVNKKLELLKIPPPGKLRL